MQNQFTEQAARINIVDLSAPWQEVEQHLYDLIIRS